MTEVRTRGQKRLGGTTPADKPIDLGSDLDDGPGSLKPVGGSTSKALNNVLIKQALRGLWYQREAGPEVHEQQRTATIAAMMAFKPRDAIEGLIVAQALAAHSAAMECYRRAMHSEQSGEAAAVLRKNAASMTRTFVELVDALDRKRGGTRQQVVRVERVMVAPGGQAIVGNVTAAGPATEGVGREKGNGQEPHAPPAGLAHDAAAGAVMPPVRRADPVGRAVPGAGDGERPMPHARRRLDRP